MHRRCLNRVTNTFLEELISSRVDNLSVLCVQLVRLHSSGPKNILFHKFVFINLVIFFIPALDPPGLWMPTAVRQRFGARDVRLQHMDHSSQLCHPFKPFLPHALSRLPVRGVPPGLTAAADDSQWQKICAGTLVATGCQQCVTAQVKRSGGSPGHTPTDLKAAETNKM